MVENTLNLSSNGGAGNHTLPTTTLASTSSANKMNGVANAKGDASMGVGYRTRLFSTLKQLFPPLSRRTLLRHYLPISGTASHTLFTANVFSPPLLSHLLPVYDMAASSAMLFQSHIGIGFYVFFRPHLYHLNAWNRVEYSVFSAVMFNFGSLLFAVLVKAILPSRLNTTCRFLLGAALGAFLLSRGYNYLEHIDRRTMRLKDFHFEHAGAA